MLSTRDSLADIEHVKFCDVLSAPGTNNLRTCHTLRFQPHEEIASVKASCGLDFSHTLRARKSASKQSGFEAVAAGVSLCVVVRVRSILNDVVLYVLAFHAN